MIHVKTPATSANMGSGYDSIGMALQLYNHLWLEETGEELAIKIMRQQSVLIPANAKNLIYKTIDDFYKQIGRKTPGIKMVQEDFIPMTRGLGSSAACIVSGLLAANVLSGENMPVEELTRIAARIEGHPDNIAPAFSGGVVVGALSDKDLRYVRIDAPQDLTFAVMTPTFVLSTEKARKVLPKWISHKDAVFNASRTGLLIASLLTGHYENLNVAMDDRLHQPYRKAIIPNMEVIFKKAKEYGAKGVFLSGAGPTIIAVVHNNDTFCDNMARFLDSIKGGWELTVMKPDNEGATVLKADGPMPLD